MRIEDQKDSMALGKNCHRDKKEQQQKQKQNDNNLCSIQVISQSKSYSILLAHFFYWWGFWTSRLGKYVRLSVSWLWELMRFLLKTGKYGELWMGMTEFRCWVIEPTW